MIRTRGDLPVQPDVRADFPGRKLSVACVVDGGRKRGTTLGRLLHVLTGLDGAIDGAGVTADDEGQGLASFEKGHTHTLQTNTFCKSRKRNAYEFCKVAEMQIFTETVQMRTWNRDLFVRLVKAKKAAGFSDAQIAEGLGEMSESTLQGYLDQRGRPPSKKLLEFAPGFLHVDLEELWVEDLTDDQKELRHARAFLRDCMGHEMEASHTDEQALQWYRHAMNTHNLARNNPK